MAKAGVIDLLFTTFDNFLHANGFRAQKGQIVDASIVRVPTQRNTRGKEDKDIKEENNHIILVQKTEEKAKRYRCPLDEEER